MNLFGDVLLPVALCVYGLIGAVVNRRLLPREFRPLVDAAANLGIAGLAARVFDLGGQTIARLSPARREGGD